MPNGRIVPLSPEEDLVIRDTRQDSARYQCDSFRSDDSSSHWRDEVIPQRSCYSYAKEDIQSPIPPSLTLEGPNLVLLGRAGPYWRNGDVLGAERGRTSSGTCSSSSVASPVLMPSLRRLMMEDRCR